MTGSVTSAATPQPPALDQNADSHVMDEKFAGSMCFVVTFMRALESDRADRVVNDPFAEPLVRKARPTLQRLLASWFKAQQHPSNFIGLRTRYHDEALNQRNPEIRQVVFLGSGLDARAFRLESLRDCHVLEIDQSARILSHKKDVMAELDAPLLASKHDCIVAELMGADWEKELLASGFDPSVPTFWGMEGLLMYLDRESNATLLKTIDALSAPGSQFWADMSGEVMLKQAELNMLKAVDSLKDTEMAKPMIKYGEDDAMHGVLSEIPWQLEQQAAMLTAGTHFGREWTPALTGASKQPVSYTFVIGSKPVAVVA
ncbi:hypothetical protein BBJ28_00004466 [Nothophytophthora sp. Chile5]|nr:hypothetical protein BBJ28_00004466 [Nothophytophthora sp. Chile5]